MASPAAAPETSLVVRNTTGNAASTPTTPATTVAQGAVPTTKQIVPATKNAAPASKDDATTKISSIPLTALVAARIKKDKKVPRLIDTLTTVTVVMKWKGVTKEYRVYKEFACYYSSMLDDAFNGPFAEGKSGVLTIDDFEYPAVFGTIQSWMYTQKLENPFSITACTMEVYSIIWILADRLLMPKLQNAVAAAMVDLRRGPQLTLQNTMYWIYKNTTPASKPRKLLVDLCAFQMEEKLWTAAGAQQRVPGQFLVDVALAFKADRAHLQMYHRSPKQVLRLEDYKVAEGTS